MNKGFANRKKESGFLENLYKQPESQMAIVYGRRRLGKTTLLRNFAKDKLTVYYMADRGGIQSQRNAMARAMAVSLGIGEAGALSKCQCRPMRPTRLIQAGMTVLLQSPK